MFHLTWKGMLGRKKESSLLLIVLVLSFLLSSALAIILPSTQAEAQLQREKTYGSWQVMLLDRSAEDCQTLAELLREQGAQLSCLTAACRRRRTKFSLSRISSPSAICRRSATALPSATSGMPRVPSATSSSTGRPRYLKR